MEVFKLTLSQMLELFLFMLVGFALKRKNILKDEAALLLSKLETLVFLPAMIISTFSARCNWENLAGNLDVLLYSIGAIILTTVLATPVSRLFSRESLERNCYKYSLIVPNSGYVGNAVILGVLGEDALFKFLIFCIPVNFFVYTIAVRWLMNAGSSKFSFKSLLNPIFLSVIIGMVIGLLELPLPAFLSTSISAAGNCMAPIAMLVTGFVIGEYDLKKLFSVKKVYILSLARLVIIPLLFYAGMKLCGAPAAMITLVVAYMARPLGMNTILLPAASGGDTTAGASMAVISNLLAILTIPLIFMLIV